MAQVIENLKRHFKNVSDRLLLKKFEEKQNLFRSTYKERVRWFELVGKKERIEAMDGGYVRDDVTLKMLFPKYANLVAPYMKLDLEEFAVLLQEGYFEGLKGYIERHTLNAAQLRALINAIIRRAGGKAQAPISEESKKLPDLLYSYLVREGMPLSLGSFVEIYPVEEIGLIKTIIENGSYIHFNILAVKNGRCSNDKSAGGSFQTYLSYLKKEGLEMPYEAEILMLSDQLRDFYKAGFHLSRKAINTFLMEDYDGVVTDHILANEVLYPMWPELKYVLEAKPKTYYKYQKALIEGSLKKAES